MPYFLTCETMSKHRVDLSCFQSSKTYEVCNLFIQYKKLSHFLTLTGDAVPVGGQLGVDPLHVGCAQGGSSREDASDVLQVSRRDPRRAPQEQNQGGHHHHHTNLQYRADTTFLNSAQHSLEFKLWLIEWGGGFSLHFWPNRLSAY